LPSVDPTNSPSSLPSVNPTSSPTSLPSSFLSSAPSNSLCAQGEESIDPATSEETVEYCHQADARGRNGRVDFKESTSVVDLPQVSVTGWDPIKREYILEVIMPSTLPCAVSMLYGSTVKVAVDNACYRIQLYEGGKLERDESDTDCSNASFKSQGIFSYFGYLDEGANEAVFTTGPFGYSGTFEFKDSSSVTAVIPQITYLEAKEFKLIITMPSCRSP